MGHAIVPARRVARCCQRSVAAAWYVGRQCCQHRSGRVWRRLRGGRGQSGVALADLLSQTDRGTLLSVLADRQGHGEGKLGTGRCGCGVPYARGARTSSLGCALTWLRLCAPGCRRGTGSFRARSTSRLRAPRASQSWQEQMLAWVERGGVRDGGGAGEVRRGSLMPLLRRAVQREGCEVVGVGAAPVRSAWVRLLLPH